MFHLFVSFGMTRYLVRIEWVLKCLISLSLFEMTLLLIVNQGFWSKAAVFSLSATKVHCLLIFWLPHLYNLFQPGIRKQHKYTSIHEYFYLAINKAKFALLLFQPSHCSGVVLCIEAGCI